MGASKGPVARDHRGFHVSYWPITSFVADTKFRRDRVDSGHRMTTANRSILTKPYRVYCFACAATAPWSKSLQAEMNFVV
jgi:hypothetical protein